MQDFKTYIESMKSAVSVTPPKRGDGKRKNIAYKRLAKQPIEQSFRACAHFDSVRGAFLKELAENHMGLNGFSVQVERFKNDESVELIAVDIRRDS